jgi:hypothetical protein
MTFRQNPLCLILFFALFLNLGIFSSEAFAQKALCKNTTNNTIVYKKVKKCQSLGYSVIDASTVGTTIELVSDSSSQSLSGIGDVSGASVSCPEGTLVTGGGASIVENDGLVLKTTIPRLALNGWSATVQALNSGATGTLNIYAICATGVGLTPSSEE